MRTRGALTSLFARVKHRYVGTYIVTIDSDSCSCNAIDITQSDRDSGESYAVGPLYAHVVGSGELILSQQRQGTACHLQSIIAANHRLMSPYVCRLSTYSISGNVNIEICRTAAERKPTVSRSYINTKSSRYLADYYGQFVRITILHRTLSRNSRGARPIA